MESSHPKNDQPPLLPFTLNRLRTQVLLSWEQEKRLLSWYGLHDGMSVLEVGSGPGFFTKQLLTVLPTSSITCIDTDPVFLAHAKQILPADVLSRVRFVEESILTTSLPEQTFDVAIARFVFQHLASPVTAAQAIWRVLKPNGKLIIIDADDALFGIVHPPVPELPLILEAHEKVQAQRGGNRRIGRHLWHILDQASFLPQALDTIAFHSDELGIEAFREYLNFEERLVPLVEAGLLSEEVLALARVSTERFFASPQRFVLMLWLAAYGQKPASTDHTIVFDR
jgi:ubiquinone/menaquinone biosynthesis C-methylase UbiE